MLLRRVPKGGTKLKIQIKTVFVVNRVDDCGMSFFSVPIYGEPSKVFVKTYINLKTW